MPLWRRAARVKKDQAPKGGGAVTQRGCVCVCSWKRVWGQCPQPSPQWGPIAYWPAQVAFLSPPAPCNLGSWTLTE